MENIKKYKWLIILICLIILILIPIKVSNNINSYAKVMPLKELVAIKGSNGQIITHLINNYTGLIEEVKTIQVDREDFANFKLVNENKDVLKDEQIAIFTSSHTQYLIEEVKGELLAQEKLLDSQLSGEKESVISEQEKIFEISKMDYLNQKKIFERKSVLFKNELISQEEFDVEKNLLDIKKLKQEKELQSLISLKTGVKTEDIQVTKEKIKLLKNQTQILQNRISSYNILAPFDGEIVGSSSLDTLFTVSIKDKYAIIIPVEVEKLSKIKLGQTINFLDHSHIEGAKIQKLDTQLKFISGKNYIVCRSQLTTNQNILDIVYPCSIISEQITIRDFAIEKFRYIFNI